MHPFNPLRPPGHFPHFILTLNHRLTSTPLLYLHSTNSCSATVVLIDPLLAALGWDTSDPELVTPEFISNGRADYALLKPGGKPLALVEAKKLGEPLENHRMQMLNYANASGIEYAGLTDGDRWELYEVFRISALDDRRILEVSINGHVTHACALQLLLLWRSNLASGRPAGSQ